MRFHLGIYDYNRIMASLLDFKGIILDCKTQVQDNYVVLDISYNTKYRAEKVQCEFRNYVLAKQV